MSESNEILLAVENTMSSDSTELATHGSDDSVKEDAVKINEFDNVVAFPTNSDGGGFHMPSYEEVNGNPEELVSKAEEVHSEVSSEQGTSASTISIFARKALAESYNEESVKLASKNAEKKLCEFYEDFLDLVVEADKEVERKEALAEARKASRLKNIKKILDSYESLKNPGVVFEQKVQTSYYTSCVKWLDALYLCHNVPEFASKLDINTWQSEGNALLAAFRVNMQAEPETWTINLVATIKEQWEKSESVKKQLEYYYKVCGDTEEKLRASVADVVSRSNDPEIYHMWWAAQMNLRLSPDKATNLADSLFSKTPDFIVNFNANIENSMEAGNPIDVAEQDAIVETVDEIRQQETEGNSFLENIGAFSGNVLSAKYKIVKSYDDARRAAMGEYADEYDKRKEEIKQRKEEIRQKKEEIKHQQRLSQVANSSNTGYNSVHGYSQPLGRSSRNSMYSSYNGRYGQGRNLSFAIPPGFIAIIVNILVATIGYLFTSGFKSIVLVFSLGLATIGLVMKKFTLSDNSIKFVVIGYAIFILALLFL